MLLMQKSLFGAGYVDILTSFCQISHTIDQREISFSHHFLEDLPEKDTPVLSDFTTILF